LTEVENDKNTFTKVSASKLLLSTQRDSSNKNDFTCFYKSDSDDKILLKDAFKESLADFWLASHYHAAMVVAAPWKRPFNDLGYNGAFLNLNEPQKCIDRTDDFLEIINLKSNKAWKYPNSTNKNDLVNCSKANTNSTIHLNKLGEAQDLYLSFIIGNSGRFFDPLKDDSKTNGDILFARAFADNYVEAILSCNKDKTGCDCDGNGKCSFEAKEVFDSKKIFNSTYYDVGKKLMLMKITDETKNRFGYAHAKFKNDQVKIEFREIDTQTPPNIHIAKTFIIDRKTVDGTQKINLLTKQKIKPKDKLRRKFLKKVK